MIFWAVCEAFLANLGAFVVGEPLCDLDISSILILKKLNHSRSFNENTVVDGQYNSYRKPPLEQKVEFLIILGVVFLGLS